MSAPPDHAPDAAPAAPNGPGPARHERAPSYDDARGEEAHSGYSGISSVRQETLDDLRAAKDFSEMIVDAVRDGLLILDFDLCVKAANESFYQTFRVEPEETLGRSIYALGNGQWDVPELRELLEDILPEDHAFNDFEVEHEFEGIGRRVMRLNGRRMNEHRLILLAIEDVTDRRGAERSLRASEERYGLLVEGTREYAMLMVDPDGGIVMWNAGAERIFGYSAEEASGRSCALLFTEHDRKQGVPEAKLAAAARDGQAMHERWYVRRDGSRFWGAGAVTALRDPDGGLRGFAKVLRDNTRRKEAEERIESLNASLQALAETLEARVEERTRQVRHLASTLTLAEQEERRRIAQLLHDDLQQMLFAVDLKLGVVRQALLAGNGEDALGTLDAAAIRLKEAGRLTRTLTVDLSPPILKNEGLRHALEWLRVQMKDLHGLDVVIDAEQSFRTKEEDLRVLLFQIVRELLFNVVKHADTDRATVALRAREHRVEITVADEGRGFDVAAAEAEEAAGRRAGFGLFSVRERLGLFGGQMKVASAPGEGTRVVLDVPLRLD